MIDKPIEQLVFLRRLQRLLDEGDFVATYKFALLNALADLSLERVSAKDDSLRLPVRDIAAKFIEYYWPQARPYGSDKGLGAVLRQNKGKQAAVVTALVDAQKAYPTLPVARAASNWSALVTRVTRTIVDMPLWKLQRVGGEEVEFLYRKSEFKSREIRLLPGVPTAFRSLHSLVLDAVRGAWLRQITGMRANRELVSNSDLASFLFGSERANLNGFRAVLREHQQGKCFYCQSKVRKVGCIDHFIAWSRYPIDLGHGLVLAHAGCNSAKRDFLAHPLHLERWQRSHMERGSELTRRFDALKLPHDQERSRAIAWWAYEQGEAAGAHAWRKAKKYEKLDGTWREILSLGGLRRVAEPPPPGVTP